jgi:hypothetical protein
MKRGYSSCRSGTTEAVSDTETNEYLEYQHFPSWRLPMRLEATASLSLALLQYRLPTVSPPAPGGRHLPSTPRF